MNVAVLGASPNPDRYANKAVRMLLQRGHSVYPVTPGHAVIEGISTAAHLGDIRDPIDTVTVYVGPKHIAPLIPEIVALQPRRIIANPGAESRELAQAAQAAGIQYVEACTLVMLTTGQF